MFIVGHDRGGRIENHKFEDCDYQELREDAVFTNRPDESNSSRLSVTWKQFGHFNGSKVSPSMFPILRGADEILQGGLVQLVLLQPGAALC
jgi:hypothetical protein